MLAEGDIVGTYRVLRKLGEGGMGAVFASEHTLLGRRAAIKVLLPALSAQQEIVQRFFNEAKAVTQVADPGIVQIFDFGFHTDGSAFIVMELLEGEPMDRRLGRIGRFAPGEAMRLMRMICTSLGAAHAKGIVHRDLKPENIYIVADPAIPGGERPKILDFGIAKLTGEEPGKLKTRTGMMMGTPVYMSPEQCRGASTVDARSDIYAIGCVLMTMLTGRPPFDGEGSGELIAAHLREPPPYAAARIPGLPPVFDQILQACLAKSPNERFQTMADLAQMLGHVEQTLQTAGSFSGLPAPAAPTIRLPTPQGQLPHYPTPPHPAMAQHTPTPAPALPPRMTTPYSMATPHGMLPAGGVAPMQTTLGGAAGQAAPATPPRRRGAILGGAVGAVVAAVVIVVAVTRSGGGTPATSSGDRPAAASSPAAPPATTTTPPAPATPPPSTTPPPPTGAAATPPAAQAAAAAPGDAGVAEPPTATRPAAGETAPAAAANNAAANHAAKPDRKHTSGGSHAASPSKGSDSTSFDRGD